ncbi:asparagine synthase-related protein [Proteiniclasticum sp. C24MP]|uniref:asparagine synthase-related protein n=1 Tax=Proteiniclasticum sp. C24MP TaxID=3374101 RepID=UPI0037546D24
MNAIAGIYGSRTSLSEIETMVKLMGHRGRSKQIIREKTFTGIELDTLKQEGEQSGKKEKILFSGKIYNAEELKKLLDGPETRYEHRDDLLVLDLYQSRGKDSVKLLEGVFAFAVYDEEKGLLMARDPFGIEPLYISEDEKEILFASEMKAMSSMKGGFREFPIGSIYEEGKGFEKYYSIPEKSGKIRSFDAAVKGIRDHLERAVKKRIERERPFGVYLSGGLDSSIIAAITAEKVQGIDSFAVGMKGSEDLKHARLCAEYLGTNHHEYVYDLKEMLSVLPDVIYHLESYDAALVRSSVANFLLARLAGEKADVVFSGEGADELFCGYSQFRTMNEEEANEEMVEMLGTLHSTGLQRGDRMSLTQGIRARVPFLDPHMVEYAMRIPLSMKIGPQGQEKWILRKAYEDMLPEEILYRKKDKFSVGAGSSEKLAEVAEKTISDREFLEMKVTPAGNALRSKEELMYYKIFKEFYPEPSVERSIDFTKVI